MFDIWEAETLSFEELLGKAKGHAGGHAHRRKASQVHPNSHHVAEVHLEERKMERVSQGPAWSFFWIFSLFFS